MSRFNFIPKSAQKSDECPGDSKMFKVLMISYTVHFVCLTTTFTVISPELQDDQNSPRCQKNTAIHDIPLTNVFRDSKQILDTFAIYL